MGKQTYIVGSTVKQRVAGNINFPAYAENAAYAGKVHAAAHMPRAVARNFAAPHIKFSVRAAV